MSSTISCRFVQNFKELTKLSEAWDKLVYQSDFPDIFATAGFARAWWRAYGTTRIMNIVVVEDEEGMLRLIAPFQAKKVSPKNWDLIGRARGDYNNFIMSAGDQDSLNCLFDWLRSQQNWDMLTLRRIPGQSTVLHFFKNPYDKTLNKLEKLLRWLNIGSWLVYQEARHDHPICAGIPFQEMHDVLQREHHRRKTKWFKTQGDFVYQVITDPAAIKAYLPQFFELHIREWSKKPAGSFLSDPKNQDFYYYIVDEMASYNALRFDVLTLNGVLIAGHIGFHWAGRLYYWLACFDSSYSKGSPGRLLLGNIIHSALQLGLNELDMLFGLETYKLDFRSEFRETGAITIYRSPVCAARLQKRLHRKLFDYLGMIGI